MRRRLSAEHGFGVMQGLFSLLIVGGVSAMYMPKMTEMLHHYLLMGVAHEVGAQIRGARVLAVTTGTTVRVRFNCPGPGEYRVLEVTNRRSIDSDRDRCSTRAFPYPDPSPGKGPDHDGPLMTLKEGVRFSDHQDFDIGPTGEITPVGGGQAPVPITISDGERTFTMHVLASGGVELLE